MYRKEIMRLLREGLLRENYFSTSTGIEDYDKLMNRDDYGKSGEVIFMSLDEYMEYVSEIQGTSKGEQYELLRRNNIKSIKGEMKRGVEYDIPYLDFADKTQEGRHRMYSANELSPGGNFPVLVVTSDNNLKNDIKSEHPYYPYFLEYDKDRYNHDGDYSFNGELLVRLNNDKINNNLINYLRDNLNISLDELLEEYEVNNIGDIFKNEDYLINSVINFTDNGFNYIKVLEERLILGLLHEINIEGLNSSNYNGLDDLISLDDLRGYIENNDKYYLDRINNKV